MPSPPREIPYTLRPASGAPRDSTLMTSAPMSARYMPQIGPAIRCASSSTRIPSSGAVDGALMAASTYHTARLLKKAHLLRWRPRSHAQRTERTPRMRPSGAASHVDFFEQPVLGAGLADRQSRNKLGAEDEDDARVVGEHGDAHEGAERSVDPVVHAHAEDVPAEEVLGALEEHGGEERAGQGRPRGDLPVREVAVGDEEERRAEGEGQGEAEGSHPFGADLEGREEEDADPPEDVEDENAREEHHSHEEEENDVLEGAPEKARALREPEDVVEHQANGGEELAREDEQDARAEEAGQAAAPDDVGEGLVQLVLVDGHDLRELVEHRVGGGPAAQHEARQRHDDEENGHQAGEEAEGETRRHEEAAVAPELGNRGLQNPHGVPLDVALDEAAVHLGYRARDVGGALRGKKDHHARELLRRADPAHGDVGGRALGDPRLQGLARALGQ